MQRSAEKAEIVFGSTLKELTANLKAHTLCPTFEGYGNFIFEHDDKTRIWGNFCDLSAVFCVDTIDPAIIKRLTKLIRANQATEAYATAKAEIAAAAAARIEAQRLADEERRAKRLRDLRSLERAVATSQAA